MASGGKAVGDFHALSLKFGNRGRAKHGVDGGEIFRFQGLLNGRQTIALLQFKSVQVVDLTAERAEVSGTVGLLDAGQIVIDVAVKAAFAVGNRGVGGRDALLQCVTRGKNARDFGADLFADVDFGDGVRETGRLFRIFGADADRDEIGQAVSLDVNGIAEAI